jgi:hypothetical protein
MLAGRGLAAGRSNVSGKGIIPDSFRRSAWMTGLKKCVLLCGAALAGLLLIGGVRAQLIEASGQASGADNVAAKDFAGTWNWMFEDKRFATMTLKQAGDQLTGSMTNGHIDLDDRGRIASATAAKGSTSIVKTTMENGKLILLAKDGDDETEFAMTLTSASTAELRFHGDGAPGNAQPIHLEKVWSEPPVAP